MTRAESVGVVGFSHSARALACHLASQGHEVHLLVRRPERFAWMQEPLMLRATGRLEGSFRVASITDRADAFASRVGTLFLATITTTYAEIAARLAPHLRGGHAVVALSSKLCGSVLLERALRHHGVHHVPVLETDAIFACRIQPDESVWVRGLTDFGALAHPVTMVANMNAVDRGDRFRFDYEGVTDRTVAVLEGVEREFHRAARAYGGDTLPMTNLLDRYYGCDVTSLRAAMRSVPNYRESWAPQPLDHRYLHEDVRCTLVPLQALARKARVPVPLVDSITHMACALTGEDFVHHGRTLEALGWERMSHREILAWIES